MFIGEVDEQRHAEAIVDETFIVDVVVCCCRRENKQDVDKATARNLGHYLAPPRPTSPNPLLLSLLISLFLTFSLSLSLSLSFSLSLPP